MSFPFIIVTSRRNDNLKKITNHPDSVIVRSGLTYNSRLNKEEDSKIFKFISRLEANVVAVFRPNGKIDVNYFIELAAIFNIELDPKISNISVGDHPIQKDSCLYLDFDNSVIAIYTTM